MNGPASRELLDLTGQVALVTGAARGIGRGVAIRLADAGAAICLVDRDEVQASHVAAEIAAAGGKSHIVGADVSRPEDAARAVSTCVGELGGLHVLVNNAGVFPFSPVLNTSEALWDKVLDVNLKGAFFFAQAAARQMKKGGGGSIVNISSVGSLHPTGALAAYDASKGGLSMLTRALALELAPFGIRVNSICPGAISTPGMKQAMDVMRVGGRSEDEVRAGLTARVPLGRIGEPDDVARATLFLASRAAEYVTGASLVVDGGHLLT